MAYLPWDRQVNRHGYLQGLIEIAKSEGVAETLINETRWDSLKMDSLDFISMVDAVDARFSVEIPMPVAAKFETVGEMIDWLEEKENGPFEFTKSDGTEFFDDGRPDPRPYR
jgi:acyl carrier protein